MPLEITTRLRAKYKARPYGRDLIFNRLPPGGEDVLRLCKLADDLESLVRDLQRRAPDTETQNEIERRLWSLSA